MASANVNCESLGSGDGCVRGPVVGAAPARAGSFIRVCLSSPVTSLSSAPSLQQNLNESSGKTSSHVGQRFMNRQIVNSKSCLVKRTLDRGPLSHSYLILERLD